MKSSWEELFLLLRHLINVDKNRFFFEHYGLNERDLERYLAAALSAGGEYADLYFEYLSSTALSLAESMVKSASQGISAGCGVRVVSAERTGYAHTDDASPARGSAGGGGRVALDFFFGDKTPEFFAKEASRQAVLQLDAREAPAGDMEVVLGPGWPGVLLHEAVGHGLEADFNRKQTSAFAGLVGKRVASEKCTVVDNGTMPWRRGSLNVDDEGQPTQSTVLIEKGVLKGYLSDKLSAKLMGISDTGNGRRESYEHIPMPRMTNT